MLSTEGATSDAFRGSAIAASMSVEYTCLFVSVWGGYLRPTVKTVTVGRGDHEER